MANQIQIHMGFSDIIKNITGRSFMTDTEKAELRDYTVGVAKELRGEARSRKQAIDKIVQEQLDRIKQDISTWRAAIEMAEDPNDPDPYELYRLYIDILDDDQVYAAKQQRISKALSGQMQLKDLDNEVNDEATSVLIKPDGTPKAWFMEFLMIALEAKFYGYSIAQFRPLIDGEFKINLRNGDKPVDMIPPEHMVPRLRAIRKSVNISVQDKANLIPIWGGAGSEWLIPNGKYNDLGLLNKIAPFWIYKKVFGAWSQHANIFGMPLRVGKTDMYDTERRQNMMDMLRDMDRATYAVLHPDDEIDFVANTSGGSGGADIYDTLVNRCDQAISKVILSQTGTTDEKAYSGSAGVHENTLNSVILLDKLNLANLVDEQLIPFLKRLGLIPEGLEVFASWALDDDVSLPEWADIVSKLSMHYDVDEDELSRKFNMTIEKKEGLAIPNQSATKEEKQAREDIKNAYKKLIQ